MYKQIAALALCGAAACFSVNAHAAIHDVTGWFINGGGGSAHYKATYAGISGTESGSGFQFNGGWRSQFIGFEGGYTDLGSVDENDGAGNSGHLSGKGWTLGLDAHINPVGKWYISGRAGLFIWKVDARAALSDGTGASGSVNGTNGYAGVGTGVDFNQHWSLGVNFDFYNMNKHHVTINTKLYSANVEYRF